MTLDWADKHERCHEDGKALFQTQVFHTLTSFLHCVQSAVNRSTLWDIDLVSILPHVITAFIAKTVVPQGGHKVAESPEFSRLFRSHNYTFPEFTATKSVRNNDLHILTVIPHQLLLMWLTRACHPILLESTVFVHQIHLAAYGWPDTGCTQSTKSVFPEVAQNSLRFPRFCMLREIPEYSRFVATLFHYKCPSPSSTQQCLSYEWRTVLLFTATVTAVD